MRNSFALATALAFVVFGPHAFSSQVVSTTSSMSAAQCSDGARASLYQKFSDNYRTAPKEAYEAAKQYLRLCEQERDEVAEYLRKWVAAYESAERVLQVGKLVYQDRDYVQAFRLGREILMAEPDNLRVLIDLSHAGYDALASGNEAFSLEARGCARKALELIEAGQKPDEWLPYTGKDEALGWLNYTLGIINLKTSPEEAAGYLYKAAQYDGAPKKTPSTYYLLAAAYETGPYSRLSLDYKVAFDSETDTPDSRAALKNINQVIDCIIDAYARAVASSRAVPAGSQQSTTEWMKRLTELYKFRHNNSDAGLEQLIGGVLSRPLPAVQ